MARSPMKSSTSPGADSKRRAKRRQLFAAGVAVAAVAAASVAATVIGFSSDAKSAAPAPAPSPLPSTPAPFQTPAPSDTIALGTAPTDSDAFDMWLETPTTPLVRLLSSDDAHDEGYSLAIVSEHPWTDTPASQLEQSVSVAEGQTYRLSFWAKSLGLEDGGIQLGVGPWTTVDTLSAPAGAYDWTQVSSEYTVPVGVSTLFVRLAVHGATTGTWIDGLSVTSVSGSGETVLNGGFEGNSADVSIVNDSVVLPQGHAEVRLATRREGPGWAHWVARNQAGEEIGGDDVLFEDGGATADLSDLPQGFYTFEVRGTFGLKVANRSAPIGILDDMPKVPASTQSAFGAGVHAYTDDQTKLENLIGSLAMIGVEYARVDMPWESIEPAPGVFSFSPALESTMAKFGEYGIQPLSIAAYRNPAYDGHHTPSSKEGLEAYARYASALVTHWASLGKDIDIYNEFNHTFNDGACGTTPSCYMDMLSVAYPKIKAANPDAVVSAPGLSGMGFHLDWLQEFVNLGGLAFTDVVSAHPYVQPNAPESLVGDLDALTQMIRDANNGQDKPIWLTEMGWATVPNWITDQQQAEFLVRTMAITLGHGVSRVYWYTAVDGSHREGDIESNFGTFEADESFLPNTNAPKLSAMAQGVMARQISGKSVTAIETLSDSVSSYLFSGVGTDTWVVWSTTEPQTVWVKAAKAVTVTTMLGDVEVLNPKGGLVSVQVSGAPVYISGADLEVSLND